MAQDPVEVFKLKAGLAQMLKGGVIMDVVNAEQVGYATLSNEVLSSACLCD